MTATTARVEFGIVPYTLLEFLPDGAWHESRVTKNGYKLTDCSIGHEMDHYDQPGTGIGVCPHRWLNDIPWRLGDPEPDRFFAWTVERDAR